jgi:dUTP pyrophosphatase
MSGFIDNLHLSLLEMYGSYMRLKIFVDSDDDDLKKKYIESIDAHNKKISSDINHIDAGFDLFSPEIKNLSKICINKLDYNVICAAKIYREGHNHNTGFYMYPRSSISKSNVRLANNVGIIDAGYRGHLIGMFDAAYPNYSNNIIDKFDRHLQICAPGLIPIVVELANSKEELGQETVRGTGGFGSTGI